MEKTKEVYIKERKKQSETLDVDKDNTTTKSTNLSNTLQNDDATKLLLTLLTKVTQSGNDVSKLNEVIASVLTKKPEEVVDDNNSSKKTHVISDLNKKQISNSSDNIVSKDKDNLVTKTKNTKRKMGPGDVVFVPDQKKQRSSTEKKD